MKNFEEIDELFKEGIKTVYPYDEQLWQKVESQLPSKTKVIPWYFNLNGFLIITMSLMSLVLKSDNHDQSEKRFYSQTLSIQSDLKPNFIAQSSTPSEQLKEHSVIAKTTNKSADQPNSTDLKSAQYSKFDQNVSKQPVSSLHIKPNAKERVKKESTHLFTNDAMSSIESEPLHTQSLKKSFDLETIEPLPLHIALSKDFLQPKGKTEKYWKLHRTKTRVYEVEMNSSISASKTIGGLENDYESYRRQKENVTSNFQIGINSIRHRKNWLYGMGVRFSSHVESMNYDVLTSSTNYNTAYDTNYRVVNGSFNNNGVPALLIEREISTRVVSNEIDALVSQKLRSEMKRIQVPFFIGLHHSFGNVYTSIRTGVNLNYTYQTIGGYISENRRAVNFSGRNSINEFAVGGHLNTSLGYSLNEYLICGFRVGYEQDITSYMKSYDSRFQHLGLGVWLMWRPE